MTVYSEAGIHGSNCYVNNVKLYEGVKDNNEHKWMIVMLYCKYFYMLDYRNSVLGLKDVTGIVDTCLKISRF